MEIISIIILGFIAILGVWEADYYKRQAKEADEAYKRLCKKYNQLKNKK